MSASKFENPFRPGAGHRPPHLAGRETETDEFRRLLGQTVILENLALTGLRGVGKTVLLDTFKPIAINSAWLWVGTDLSESASVSEESLALRLLTDMSVVTSTITFSSKEKILGFTGGGRVDYKLGFDTLNAIYEGTPGLVADKLKFVLEFVWQHLERSNGSKSGKEPARGVIFAYDEAQNLTDQARREQYPLSMLLDVFQSLQKKGVRFMLVLSGLPNLFPQLVDARTYAERMFRVVFLDRLDKNNSRDAILKPIEASGCPIRLKERTVGEIVRLSGGYPYFLQFMAREVFDVLVQRLDLRGRTDRPLPLAEIIKKLDTDFFAGRWDRATERQRDLLMLVAGLEDADTGFTVREVVEASKGALPRSFSASHVSQLLASLIKSGLVLKQDHGKYSLALPMLRDFILRQVDVDR